jgi:AraC family transcriptional regulator
MTFISQLRSRRSLGVMQLDGLQVGLAGHVASSRGVQLVVIDGMLNHEAQSEFTSTIRLLSHTLQQPENGTINVARQGWRRQSPTNFFTPGVPLSLGGGGSVISALCVFQPDFFTSLSETEEYLRFSDVDYLADIQSERMTYLGQSMFREAIAPGFAASLFAESIGLAIQVEITRYDGAARSGDGVRRGGLAGWQMRRIESYVGDNLSTDITLDELARLIGISVRQLSRAVRQEKGVSVHRWVANRRLSEARRLLMETDMSIGEIAGRCAFHSSTAFGAAFRAASSFSPAEFRRLHAL